MQGFTPFLLLMALLAGPELLSEGAQANTDLTEDTPAAVARLSIQYDKGLLAARILNTPLAEVGRELAHKTGARFILSDPRLPTLPVSATFKGLPLREGIRKILAGFSYAVYPSAETGQLEVNVLAAPEGPAAKNPAAAGGGPASRTGTHVADNAPLPPASVAGIPPSLEDLRAVEMEVDPEARLAREHETQAREQNPQEALLQHALKALNSGNPQLHTETLALLQGIDDPRATEMLIAAALNGDAQDSKAQVQAVEILWRHVAYLEFRDEAAVDALKQLAYGSDSQAAEVARQALQSMEEYEQHSATPWRNHERDT